MAARCHAHIEEVLDFSRRLLALVQDEAPACDHDGCLILDGVVRDCAYRLRQAAQELEHELTVKAASSHASGSRPHGTGKRKAMGLAGR